MDLLFFYALFMRNWKMNFMNFLATLFPFYLKRAFAWNLIKIILIHFSDSLLFFGAL